MEFPFSRRQISIQTHKLPPKTNPDFYAAAFLHAPQAILVLTRDGRILDGNPAVCQLFGCPLEELRERNIHVFFPNQHVNIYREVLETELTLGSVTLHTSMQSVRGTAFRAEIILHAYDTDAQNLLLAYIQDVSERTEEERRFEEHEGLLDGTRHIASHLLSTTTWENEMPSLLAYLGMRLRATRVCVFRNVPTSFGTLPESATPGHFIGMPQMPLELMKRVKTLFSPIKAWDCNAGSISFPNVLRCMGTFQPSPSRSNPSYCKGAYRV